MGCTTRCRTRGRRRMAVVAGRKFALQSGPKVVHATHDQRPPHRARRGVALPGNRIARSSSTHLMRPRTPQHPTTGTCKPASPPEVVIEVRRLLHDLPDLGVHTSGQIAARVSPRWSLDCQLVRRWHRTADRRASRLSTSVRALARPAAGCPWQACPGMVDRVAIKPAPYTRLSDRPEPQRLSAQVRSPPNEQRTHVFWNFSLIDASPLPSTPVPRRRTMRAAPTMLRRR